MLRKLNDKTMKMIKIMCLNYHFSQYDIIVSRRSGNNVPNRLPQSYTNGDILKNVDGLYVAVRRAGAPKSDEVVTIGNGITNRRKRRNLASKSFYISVYRIIKHKLQKIYKTI